MSVNNRSGAGVRSAESVFGTPPDFLMAVTDRFGDISFDLAASHDVSVCKEYFTRIDDSLSPDTHWPTTENGDWLWLNPPFGNVGKWMDRCSKEAHYGRKIMALVPASVGSNWFADSVFERAFVKFLRPRLTFVGHSQPFPKDLMLCLFNRPAGFLAPAPMECWRWK